MIEVMHSTLETVFSPGVLTHPMTAVFVATVIAVLIYVYGTYGHWVLKKLNIPGAKPLPFLGNLRDFRKYGGIHRAIQAYRKKYGKVFSLCVGRSAAIVIADPEMLKQILVNDFIKFRNRFQVLPSLGAMKFSLLNAKEEDWNRIRSTITPSFSSGKLRHMVYLIEESCDTLAKKLGEVADTGRSIDMMSWFSQMTLEVILSTAFGVQSNVQENPNSEFAKRTKSIFQSPRFFRFFAALPFSFLFVKLFTLFTNNLDYFMEIVKEIIKTRREAEQQGRNDFIQLMLTAHEATGGSKLSEEEIMAQSVTFLLAGHETSSNSLTMISYYLALNPEVQERLRLEIMIAMQTNSDKPVYELIQDVEYVDCVINESLRMNPPAHTFNRECAETCTIDGITIPAGINVIIPVYTLHHDPEVWSEPETFDPERFRGPSIESRHPFQFLPFGAGPRNCIGMRFALMEVKIVLLNILTKYKFVRSPETQVPLAIIPGATLTPRDGVFMRIEAYKDNYKE